MTVRWLSKLAGPKGATANKIVVCTGERMESLILKVYPGIRTTTFEPAHEQGRLSNEFRCYANFEGNRWTWQREIASNVPGSRQK